MECPEVWSFNEPEPLIHIEEFINFPEAKLNNLPFNHLISVILPNATKTDLKFADSFCNDCQYYKVTDFDISVLLEKTFLNGFIRTGRLAVFSIGTRIDGDNCLAVIPSGKLFLRLNKDTYEQLPLQGKVSHFSTRIGEPYIVTINLKDRNLDPERASAQKLQKVLAKLEKFEVILCWKPPTDDVCPSSIAKYLNSQGYTVTVCTPKFEPHMVFTKMMPLFKSEFTSVNKDDHDAIAEFLEWLGMVAIDGDMNGEPENYTNTYEPPISCILSDSTQILQFRGFFLPEDVLKMLNYFREYNATAKKPWIALYIQGFADCIVGWNSEENQYFLNGDNGYVVIFNEEKSMLVNFGCSRKRLK